MRRMGWQIRFALLLCLASALLYGVHFLVFRDAHHIAIYLLGDVAFVPIEVLLVTLIIHRVLTLREKRALLSKLNMVIGAFFSEVGTRLIARLSQFDPGTDAIGRDLVVTGDWRDDRFGEVALRLRGCGHELNSTRGDLRGLREFLLEKRPFFLRLLENPNLLEHDTFTDLLWAVFHLTEELAHRDDLRGLPDSDLAHLSGDMRRAYMLLIEEWLAYMRHLKGDYPYLFSLAMRTNPFDPAASPIVSGK